MPPLPDPPRPGPLKVEWGPANDLRIVTMVNGHKVVMVTVPWNLMRHVLDDPQ